MTVTLVRVCVKRNGAVTWRCLMLQALATVFVYNWSMLHPDTDSEIFIEDLK